MKHVLSIARHLIVRSLGQLFRNGRSNDPEKWIEEFKLLSGRGHNDSGRFNRYEAHER